MDSYINIMRDREGRGEGEEGKKRGREIGMEREGERGGDKTTKIFSNDFKRYFPEAFILNK